VTELISYMIGIPIVNKLRRKISFPGMFLITTLSSCVFFFSGDNSTLNLVLGIINKVYIYDYSMIGVYQHLFQHFLRI
jgi:hypothetical protein